jgi:dTDP-4-dehydrorhamnose 3,5-epimerase
MDVTPSAPQDGASVDTRGARTDLGIAEVDLARLVPHADDRGLLMEIFNPELDFWREPVVYSYCVTIRPGRIKGWGMHRLQHDRYWLPSGQLRVVLYDDREGSATRGRFEQFHFTDASPGLLRIPPGVWHADQNWGDRDAVILNFPTVAYDAANPDKYRIDPHAGVIPFDWKLADG